LALCEIEHVATAPHTASEACRYDDNAKYCATTWAVSGAAQNDDATGWFEANRGLRGTQPLPERPITRGDAASAGIGAV